MTICDEMYLSTNDLDFSKLDKVGKHKLTPNLHYAKERRKRQSLHYYVKEDAY